MFGLPVVWLVAAGLVAALWGGSVWKGYVSGKNHVQHEWDIDKAEKAAAQAIADESMRLKARAASVGYEQDRANRQVRVITITKEVQSAIEANPAWGAVALPQRVHDAASAAAQALVAPEPDAAVSVRLAEPGDQRGPSGGLRVGLERLRGVFGQASSPR